MRLRPITMAALALALALLPAGPARSAEILGQARVGFSADRLLVIDGHRYLGKLWQMPGEQRHEQQLPALKPVFILHADSAVADILLPPLHTVAEIRLPKELSLLDDSRLLRRPVGKERVNGIATTKYAIDEDTPEGRASGTLWLSRDGIAMKCDGIFRAKNGRVTRIHWELSHVRIGPQPAALFTVPPGYARLPMAAVAPLLGLRQGKRATR